MVYEVTIVRMIIYKNEHHIHKLLVIQLLQSYPTQLVVKNKNLKSLKKITSQARR